jgi:hypothetical protein
MLGFYPNIRLLRLVSLRKIPFHTDSIAINMFALFIHLVGTLLRFVEPSIDLKEADLRLE